MWRGVDGDGGSEREGIVSGRADMSLFRPSAAVCCSADDVISTCCLLLQMRCTSTAEGGWGLRRVGGDWGGLGVGVGAGGRRQGR